MTMNWNDGPNKVEIPEGVTAHDICVMPVIQILKRDDDASGKCPDCRRNRDQMGHVEKLTTMGAAKIRFPDGVSGTVEIPGDALKVAENLVDFATDVRVFYRPRDEFILARGVKRANQRAEDPLDEYERSKWEGPIAEFEIAGGRDRARAFLAAHNAMLIHDHAAYSDHEAHANVTMEVARG